LFLFFLASLQQFGCSKASYTAKHSQLQAKQPSLASGNGLSALTAPTAVRNDGGGGEPAATEQQRRRARARGESEQGLLLLFTRCNARTNWNSSEVGTMAAIAKLCQKIIRP